MQVMDLIAKMNLDEGTTFLISTHDKKIAGLCRRQIEVGAGWWQVTHQPRPYLAQGTRASAAKVQWKRGPASELLRHAVS